MHAQTGRVVHVNQENILKPWELADGLFITHTSIPLNIDESCSWGLPCLVLVLLRYVYLL